ncbi:hypothetical protein ABI59_18560 [Acidobacteria bacterium Mor1]|nr:hypothetical protein ABI59_18560 [Acidobacteria bacterium Mor1]
MRQPVARCCSPLFLLSLVVAFALAAPPAAAVETVCDGLDDDGNMQIDEGCDDDGDDYCDASLVVIGAPAVCPLGGGDCNDENASVNPGRSEVCNDVDDDCFSGVDNGCDDDGDGYCDQSLAIIGAPMACPSGGGDCDDESSAINPGSAEICDGVDNDCAAGVDNGCDDDGDGYCDQNMAIIGSPPSCPQGGGDCDDGNGDTYPGAPEFCDDGTDSDCDGDLDPDGDSDGISDCVDNCPGVANPAQTNGDGDGSGDLCDCAPNDSRVYVQAPEINDSRDNQCPGDPGFGLIDEISGLAGFTDPDKKFAFCWTAQTGASDYRVIRADDPMFLSGCKDAFTTEVCSVDGDIPQPMRVHHYLVAPVAPNRGSFGADSRGVQRAGCP